MNKKLKEPYISLDERTSGLLQSLSGHDEKVLALAPSPGRWSVIQVLYHLSEVERLALGYCKKKIRAGDEMPDRTLLGNLKLNAYLRVLRTRIKFNAPAMISSPKGDRSFSQIMEIWALDRKELEDFLKNYPEKFLDKAIYRNPVAGRCTLPEMVRFFEAHMKHHEYQINNILVSSPVWCLR